MTGHPCSKLTSFMSRAVSMSEGKAGDRLFFIAFAILFINRFYRTTMFTSVFGQTPWIVMPSYAAALAALILAVFTVIDRVLHHKKEGVIFCAILLTGLLCFLTTGWKDPLFLCCLMVAASGRDMGPVLSFSVAAGALIMAAAFIASRTGFIPDLSYDTGSGRISHAFGIVYRTDFAAHLLYIVMGFSVLKGEKLRAAEYVMLWIFPWITWRYASARTDTFCLGLFLLLLGGIQLYRLKKGRWPKIPGWSAGIHTACALLAFAAVQIFGAHPAEADPMREGALSDVAPFFRTLMARLVLSRRAFEQYPVNLFGHVVEERGAGGMADAASPYFFVDISYVRILIFGGVALFAVYISAMTLASARFSGTDAIIALSLMFVAIEALSEHHALSIAYNVFILYAFGGGGAEPFKPGSQIDIQRG